MVIRNATAADAAEIEHMIRDLVTYEGGTGTPAFGVGQLAAALAQQGKRKVDKRESEKERDWKREQARLMSRRSREG